MTKNQIKMFARQFIRGIPIPFFQNMDINKAIDKWADHYHNRKTHKRNKNNDKSIIQD